MRRTCERPGCAEPASVAYGMVPEDLLVWLEPCDPAEVHEPRPGLLCRRHADAMVVPVGWTLDDRREPVPRLFRPPAAQPTGGFDQTGSLRRPRRPTVPTPKLFDEPRQQRGTHPVAEDVEEADATGWTPRFDPDDDLGGLLDADSPLLSRAFGSRRRGD